MNDKDITAITSLQQRVRELKVSATMVVEEATNIERELERIYAPQVKSPGKQAGSLLTEAEMIKLRAPVVKMLAKAVALSKSNRNG